MDIGLDSDSIENMSGEQFRAVQFNLSSLPVFKVSDDTEVTALADPVYEQFLADVWVGIVLTLMVLSCVCFMCSCLIYHKFQEWKHRVINTRTSANVEAGTPESELPSYTIASGLPTYEEALEQLKKVKELTEEKVAGGLGPKSIIAVQQETIDAGRRQEQTNALQDECDGPTNCGPTSTLSVFNLFGIYNYKSGESRFSKPS